MNPDLLYFKKIFKVFSYIGLTPLNLYMRSYICKAISKAQTLVLLVLIISAAFCSIQALLKEIEPGFLNIFNTFMEVSGDAIFLTSCVLTTMACRKNWKSFFRYIEMFDRKNGYSKVRSAVSILLIFLALHIIYFALVLFWLFSKLPHLPFLFNVSSFYIHVIYTTFKYFATEIISKRYSTLCRNIKTVVREFDQYSTCCKLAVILRWYGLLCEAVGQLNLVFGWPNLFFNTRVVIVIIDSINLVFMRGLILKVDADEQLLIVIQNIFSIVLMLVSLK